MRPPEVGKLLLAQAFHLMICPARFHLQCKVQAMGSSLAPLGTCVLWIIFQCVNLECCFNSFSIEAINLSRSGCARVTCKGMASRYPSGCDLFTAKAQSEAK